MHERATGANADSLAEAKTVTHGAVPIELLSLIHI